MCSKISTSKFYLTWTEYVNTRMLITYNQITIYDLNKQHIFSRIQQFIGFVFPKLCSSSQIGVLLCAAIKKVKSRWIPNHFLKNTDLSDRRLLCWVVMVTHVVIWTHPFKWLSPTWRVHALHHTHIGILISFVHCSSITIFLEILLYQLLLRSYVVPLMIISYGIPLFYGVW